MLKKYSIALILVLLICDLADAQSFYRRNRNTGYLVTFGLGTASYQGDPVNPQVNFDLSGVVTGGIEIPINNTELSIRTDLTWFKLSADDKLTTSNDNPINRNLSFESSNLEFSVMGVYKIINYDPRRSPVEVYAMVGLGGTYFNPKADLNGTLIALQPLQTEGVDYSRLTLVVPGGLGVRFRFAYNWGVGIEGMYRLTTTDYLDDVSSVYVDNGSFIDANAAALADRRPEIGLPVRPAGFQRGDADDNDGYFTIAIKANYYLNKGLYYKRKRNRRSKIFRRR